MWGREIPSPTISGAKSITWRFGDSIGESKGGVG